MRSKAAKVALCGVVSALSVVLMLMTGIVPIATIALPALAGCLTIAIVAETNVRYGFAVYCVFADTGQRSDFVLHFIFRLLPDAVWTFDAH